MKRKVITLLVLLAAGILYARASVYNTLSPQTLSPGTVIQVFNAETPTPGTGTTAASQQVEIFCSANGMCPFAVDGKFSGAPGAFEVDVQVAAVDSDTNYQTVSNGNVTTVDATNNTFHLDGTLVTAKFGRLLIRSRTNAVSITAFFTGG